MKSHKILMPAVAGLLFAGVANAQVDMTITGSTAWRSITFERAASLFDAGYTAKGDTNIGPGTFSGTMSSAIPSLGSTPVTLRLSFSGSAAGMLAVDGGTQVPTVDPNTGNTSNSVPLIGLSDVFPESATPPINGSDFDQFVVGVVPFVFVKNTMANSSLISCTNMTREQAYLLMTASGIMPCSFIGGSSSAPVYLTGRDSGSGTRITTQADVGFFGTPLLWVTNGISSTLFSTNQGFSSAGLERNLIGNYTNAIGYLGLADAAAISGTAAPISYEGIAYSPGRVQGGMYPLWGYEHFVSKHNGLSANQQLVRNALVTALTNQTYQTTSPLYTNNFVDQLNMKVKRGADGGPITSTTF